MNNKKLKFETLHIALVELNQATEKTILFVHGNSGSVNSWKHQLNDPLFSKYRLIALDLPGHGSSSVSLAPDMDYSIPGMGKIMADSIKKLNLTSPYILVGFSLGANVIAEMTTYLKPDGIVLVSSSVIGGEYTLAEAFQEGIDGDVFFNDNADSERIDKAMKKASFHSDKEIHDVLLNDYKNAAQGFRPTMLKTFLAGSINNEIDLLKNSDIPVMVVFGKEEEMANPNYLDAMPFNTWKKKIFKIDQAGHYVQMDQPEQFNKLLADYAQDIFKE